MFISASRRTDIPANYSDWFFNRVAEGFVLVRNPMNPRQVSRIPLDPESVDCFIFWTKYPERFIGRLGLLKNYKFYFQFTVTPYGQDIEKRLPKKDHIIEVFQNLSEIIGGNRIIWRYDPILLNNGEFSVEYHLRNFSNLCKRLSKYTKLCVISFFDNYKFASFNSKNLKLVEIKIENMRTIGFAFTNIARDYGLKIETCAESVDLSDFGISHGKCVDDRMISEILGYDIEIEKDKSQREFCGCVKSVDIGSYSTCLNNCLYCYATKSYSEAYGCFQKHNPSSPLLFGELTDHDKVITRKNDSFRVHQPKLF